MSAELRNIRYRPEYPFDNKNEIRFCRGALATLGDLKNSIAASRLFEDMYLQLKIINRPLKTF